jgi:large subunit ribosomal protein L1
MLTQQIKGSKRYKEAASKVDFTQSYSLQDASALLNTLPKAKFDETVELYAHLTVDPRKSDQMVRGTLQLPHGSGKTVRVIVFTENPQEALDNGADAAGLEDLIEKVTGGWTDFDVALSTTSAMKSVRTVARVVGPRGLMPNPKSGTVSDDIPAAIKFV